MEKIDKLVNSNNIPNILLYGSELSDIKNVLEYFLSLLYDNNKHKNVFSINCAEYNQGGIRFIRNELKYFCKIVCKKNKMVILKNANKLTQDAQSALRRCIEIYSKYTRFIIIVDNKNTILKPILSRFCIIYIPDIKPKKIYSNNNLRIKLKKKTSSDKLTHLDILNYVEKLYDQGIHIFNLLNYVENDNSIDSFYKYELLCFIDLIRQSIYNEKICMFILLYHIIMRPNIKLDNILYN